MFSELGRKSHRKRHQQLMKINDKSVQKSIQNRGAEKYRKITPKYQKKGRKWTQRAPKSRQNRG